MSHVPVRETYTLPAAAPFENHGPRQLGAVLGGLRRSLGCLRRNHRFTDHDVGGTRRGRPRSRRIVHLG